MTPLQNSGLNYIFIPLATISEVTSQNGTHKTVVSFRPRDEFLPEHSLRRQVRLAIILLVVPLIHLGILRFSALGGIPRRTSWI